jgi:hypothetical protein
MPAFSRTRKGCSSLATRLGAQERKIDIYRLPLKKPKIENGAALFKDESCKK